ncbi:MAG: DNA internalization-related competence protein ComEC/Rec2 [Candidatus Omnitrophota bacterium]
MNRQPHDSQPNGFHAEPPRPMFGLALAFIAGIVYARAFPSPLAVTLPIVFLLALWWAAASRRDSLRRNQRFHRMMALALAASLGAVRMESMLLSQRHMDARAADLARQGEQTVSGKVEEIRNYESGSASIILSGVRLEKWNRERPFPANIELLCRADDVQTAAPGDRIQAQGAIYPVRGPGVPTPFNFQEYRYSQNIFAAAYAQKDSVQIQPSPRRWSRPRGLAYAAANAVQQRLSLPEKDRGDIAALVAAIAFGVRSNLSSRLNDNLQKSGLAHITSISGLHATFILFGFASLLKRMGLTRRRSAFLTAVLGVFYLSMVGVCVPALRAVLMAFVLLGSYFTERRAHPLNMLGLAALAILFLYPGELFLPSFQLSFAAVLMLFLYQPLDAWLCSRLPWLFRGFVRSLSTSTIVVAGLAPFTIYYFHRLPWSAVLGNLAAIPLTAFFMPAAYLWTLSLFLPFSILTRALEYPLLAIGSLLAAVIHFFGGREAFSIVIPNPGLFPLALFFFVMILLARPALEWFRMRKLRFRSFHLALFLAALALWSGPLLQWAQPLRVDFLGLGQGDCALIRTPSGKVMLVDGGPPASAKRQPLLVEYLLAQGVQRIDAMALTHPQADHIGALAAAAQAFPVGLVLESLPDPANETYRHFSSVLDRRKIPRRQARAGDIIQLDGQTKLWTLNPDDETLNNLGDVNDASLVFLLQYGDWEVLLTGDIGQKIEKRLCDKFDDWDVDVLKVPHHGSRYASSAEFLAETQPEFAVIQVGRNAYGHPSEEARNRLYAIGAHVLRTDYDGTIQLAAWRQSLKLYASRANRAYVHRNNQKNSD